MKPKIFLSIPFLSAINFCKAQETKEGAGIIRHQFATQLKHSSV